MTHQHRGRLVVGAIAALALAGCTGDDPAGEADAPDPDTSPETSTTTQDAADASSAAAESAAGSTLDTILAEGAMQVCTTGDYPPFTELDEDSGEFSGIDVDMARDLGDTLGVEVEFVQTSWETLMEDFLADCDIAVGGISINTARAEQAFFSAAVMADGKTPIARCEDVGKYRTVDQINDPDVTSIMPKGGTNEVFAQENYPEGDLVTHDNLTIFNEIVEGRADVMTTDRSEVLYIAQEYDELCATNPDEPFDYFEKAFLLPRGDVVLKHYVDQWLTMALNDGTYEEITEPWLGDVDLALPDRG